MEWKEVRLGDIADVQTGPFGSQLHKENYVNKGTPIVTVEHLGNKWFTSQNLPMVSDEDKLRLTKYCSQEGDVIFSRVGSVDRCSYVSKEYSGWLFSGRCLRVRPRSGINPEYLYYFLTNEGTKQYIRNIAVGATMPSINTKLLNEVPITIPSLDDQRRIASVLSSLDRKIELNNKINADLEEMAQAIFKNWFVDFEPFKNGKFVDSELGMIPEGWKVGSYSEMIDSLISGDWGKEKPQGNYTHEVACVRGCDFQDINNGVRGKTPQRYILEKNYQVKHLKDKDILVEISGGTATVSTGRTSLVTEELLKKYNHDIVCTNFCKVLRPLSQFSSYVYYSWKYKYDNDIMFGYENGTSGIKNFAIKDFIEKEPVLIPKEQDIVEFQKIIDNLQKQKQIKGTENTTLSLLRDTLLPRLMSGELEVPE